MKKNKIVSEKIEKLNSNNDNKEILIGEEKKEEKKEERKEENEIKEEKENVEKKSENIHLEKNEYQKEKDEFLNFYIYNLIINIIISKKISDEKNIEKLNLISKKEKYENLLEEIKQNEFKDVKILKKK